MKNLFNYNNDETIFKILHKVENKIGYKTKRIQCIAAIQKNDSFLILTHYQKKDLKNLIILSEIQIISEVYLEKTLVKCEEKNSEKLI